MPSCMAGGSYAIADSAMLRQAGRHQQTDWHNTRACNELLRPLLPRGSTEVWRRSHSSCKADCDHKMHLPRCQRQLLLTLCARASGASSPRSRLQFVHSHVRS